MNENKKIIIGADHAGFSLKEFLKEKLTEKGYTVVDKGAHEYNEADDYPDFVVPTALGVLEDPENSMGIVIGGSGQGEAIVANRFGEIRAVVFNGQYKPIDGRDVPEEIKLSREHNDANVLSLGARFLSNEEALDAVLLWIETPFSEDARHARRIRKIDSI